MVDTASGLWELAVRDRLVAHDPTVRCDLFDQFGSYVFGSGDWTIACGVNEPAGMEPDVVVRVPVVAFCARFADRLPLERVPFQVDGDVELGRSLLVAAPAFAGR
jgi:hypothetical protein